MQVVSDTLPDDEPSKEAKKPDNTETAKSTKSDVPTATALSKSLARGPQLPPEALHNSNKRQKSSAVSSFFTVSFFM